MLAHEFLSDLVSRPWVAGTRHDFSAVGLFLGNGLHAIEVAVVKTGQQPSHSIILECWRARRRNRAAPVLLVVFYPNGVALCGATGEKPPVYSKLEVGHVERLCRETLGQPDRHASLRFLSQALPSLETDLPGLNNEGLLALHELLNGVPMRSDWLTVKSKAAAALSKRGSELLVALDFQIEPIDNLTSLLKSSNRRTALAVLLKDNESPESGNDRFNSLSPVSYALRKADDENLSWVILTQGSRIRLYATSTDIGVGRSGRTETYIECQLSLLPDDLISYLWLLYSADALACDGSLTEILGNSRRFAGDLAENLRNRIYNDVVPILAKGIAVARGIESPPSDQLTHTYEMALTTLFRILFIAYAEDRDLLPYRFNENYRRRSLKQKAQELAMRVDNGTPVATGDSHWNETVQLWKAVAKGNSEWSVPAYDGGLFTDDPNISIAGAKLATITVSNEYFEAALRNLLVIETPEGAPGPVDFRSLGVREFGTIYEGLLESELALADTNLTLDTRKAYVPAREKQQVVVGKGEIYLHNRSGARKSSGSYYTKSFAVEHLLDGALDSALDEHFSRLDDLDDTEAAETLFDFRVADIAMGSGHFLIGAIDRIEKRMYSWLTQRRIPIVRRELASLRSTALAELQYAAGNTEIEDSQLLRRLIARRCIFGVDLNALSVQLARLAVWIHTFVPGLPLSFLDRNLVRGNSLIGVSSVEEICKKFKEMTGTLFEGDPELLLGAAKIPLRRLANINDANLSDIAAARKAVQEVSMAIKDTENLCDIIAAQSISDNAIVTDFLFEQWHSRARDSQTLTEFNSIVVAAKQALEDTHALHFPIAFPEVFLRDRPGFDVILGNPPWQEATIEELAFWARHFPGLRGRRIPQSEKEKEKIRLRRAHPNLVKAFTAECEEMERVRKVLSGGAFPGMETGDPDLYKAFYWRFWHLATSKGGRIGVVLPRSALAAKGSTKFRIMMFEKSAQVNITMLLNKGNWVFDEVHPQYSIGLVCVTRGEPTSKSIHLLGPFDSLTAFHKGVEKTAIMFHREDVLAWNDTASLPLLPNPDSVDAFVQFRKSPRLGLNDMGGG